MSISSLFDYSGVWSKPYRDAGYTVYQYDLKFGDCIFDDVFPAVMMDVVEYGLKLHGILAAVPCTDYANSGARWWKDKLGQPAPYEGSDVVFEDRLDYFNFMVAVVYEIVAQTSPEWWVIENPRGRLRRLNPYIGEAKLVFNPY